MCDADAPVVITNCPSCPSVVNSTACPLPVPTVDNVRSSSRWGSTAVDGGFGEVRRKSAHTHPALPSVRQWMW